MVLYAQCKYKACGCFRRFVEFENSMTLTVGPERFPLSDTGPMTTDHPMQWDDHLKADFVEAGTGLPAPEELLDLEETSQETFDRYRAEDLLAQLYVRGIRGGSDILPYTVSEVDTLIRGLREASEATAIEAADVALRSMRKHVRLPQQLVAVGEKKGEAADTYERLAREEDIDAIDTELFQRDRLRKTQSRL